MEEQRKATRKLVRVKVLVKAGDGDVVLGRTFDLGRGGVGVVLEAPLQDGAQARVNIGLLLNGVATPIQAQVRVQYSIYSNGEYRIGLQFLQLDAATAATLEKFLH